MFTKISYLVYKVLAELSKGPKKRIYSKKKKQLRSQMVLEKYGMLYESLKKSGTLSNILQKLLAF